ncbi:MAG TPA: EthD domain-containing protein [Hymenobacter sp.]|jgi:hypothetical protein|uniref:EthD domain-containing protein n=1 Tax=Hymenobacter sp. TaxID=1898978 RepID=UPI002ED922D6
MIKQLIAVRRRPGLTHQECLDYVEHVHGEIARGGPEGLLRYVQSHVFDSAFGAATDSEYQQVFGRDFVTELYFESPQTMHTNGESEYVRTVVQPDETMFNEVASVMLGTTAETEVPVPHPGPGPVKVMHFLKKADGLADEDFQQQLAEAHAALLAQQPAMAAALRRYVLSLPIPAIGTDAKYFGPSRGGRYEPVASMWFEDEAALGAFRAYQRALASGAGAAFIDFSQSFFLYTRERVIIG